MQTSREERSRTAETENATLPNSPDSSETQIPKCSGPPLAVIGLGKVGSALLSVLGNYHPVSGFDIVGEHSWQSVLESAIAFVCVQTPGADDGRLDCQHVYEVLERLSADGYAGVVTIRSTVRVGFMEEAVRRFPDLCLVYFPEFIRERSRFAWTANPDRLVIAGPKQAVDEVLAAFDWVDDDVPRLRMKSYRDAEIGKLVHNAYIATKVSFTNEVEQISLEQGADPEEVMSVVWADRRVLSREHLRPGLGPYGGSCVPKDTHELRTVAGNPLLLSAVERVNERARSRAGVSNPSPESPVDLKIRTRSNEVGA